MTSDKVLRDELKQAEAELMELVGSVAQIEGRLHRLSERMSLDDDLRNRLIFRYDLSGESDNIIVPRIQGFMAENSPEGFDIPRPQLYSIIRTARELENTTAFNHPEFSSDTFDKAVGLAFQLGYISGWNHRKAKRQRKAQ